MTETATFGAGCFWGVEWVFRKVPGVIDAVSGYSGGTTRNPTYRDVCSHVTGHAEVVRVTFDPAVVTFEQLLEVFWAMHDPTQVDRQGPDIGDQYRSVILTETPEQEVRRRRRRRGRRRGSRARSRPTSSRSRRSTRPRTITSGITTGTGTRRTATCSRPMLWRRSGSPARRRARFGSRSPCVIRRTRAVLATRRTDTTTHDRRTGAPGNRRRPVARRRRAPVRPA